MSRRSVIRGPEKGAAALIVVLALLLVACPSRAQSSSGGASERDAARAAEVEDARSVAPEAARLDVEHEVEGGALPEASVAHAADGTSDSQEEGEHDDHGPVPPVWLVIPFALLLVMIATGPLFYSHHWHHHYPKYAVGLGLLVAAYYLTAMRTAVPVVHAIQEYLAFIALVASLFIAASGIYVKVNARGAPVTNVVLLFIASLIANIIATTGAAMLFIRTYMRLNTGRLKPYHIVFFIFIVANVGGALTPIGDPPLFLGFLRGVPFFWTLSHVWHIWALATVLILGVFFVIDFRNKARGPEPEEGAPTIELEGLKNVLWIAIIIGSVFLDPNVVSWVPVLHLGSVHLPFGIREIIMLTVAVLAYRRADRAVLEKNEFTFEPIREVGWLFLGIFFTMQPALANIAAFAANNADSLTVGMFYWGTGVLSAVLDNAPTYLNFVSAAMGKFGLDVNNAAEVVQFALPHLSHPDSWYFLQAISVAAVFFGAMSYIGNAPNFMVRAIAEANGIETPTFMGYIIRYSIPILLPIYFIVYVIFYSGWI